MTGTLWLVGTPIGNLKDTSDRARQVLAGVEIIACEDTRRTGKLLKTLQIESRARLVSYFEANERKRIPQLLEDLRAGRDVALVSDGGMPALSDPGYRLVRACLDEGLAVDAAPGPSAVVTALVLSGLPTDRFAFEGFPPRKPGARRDRLRALAGDPRTLVFYESPVRLGSFLSEAADVLGDRRAAVGRELTKMHQEVARGRLSELAEWAEGGVKGEVTVVIEGAVAEEPEDLEALGERVRALMEGGASRKEASARIAEETGVSRRALYQASLGD